MTGHPNRNRAKRGPSPGQNPTPEQIRAARDAAGLSQEQAGKALFRGLRTWQNWEFGINVMPADSFCLFLLITGQTTLEQVIEASENARIPA